jgi:hypothetical protein
MFWFIYIKYIQLEEIFDIYVTTQKISHEALLPAVRQVCNRLRIP